MCEPVSKLPSNMSIMVKPPDITKHISVEDLSIRRSPDPAGILLRIRIIQIVVEGKVNSWL